MKCLTFPTERKTFLCLHFCLNFQSPLCFYSRFGYVTLTADLHVHQEAWFYFNLFMERLVIRLERVIDPRCSKHWAWPTLLSQLWIQFSDGSENYRGWHTALTRTLLNVAQLTVWVCFPQVELPHCPRQQNPRLLKSDCKQKQTRETKDRVAEPISTSTRRWLLIMITY